MRGDFDEDELEDDYVLVMPATEGASSVVEAIDTSAKLKSKEMLKGTGDVLKDIAYAQKFTDVLRDQMGGREMDFVDRALRVAMAEIKQLRARLETANRKRSVRAAQGEP